MLDEVRGNERRKKEAKEKKNIVNEFVKEKSKCENLM